jgi:hypothetical protein
VSQLGKRTTSDDRIIEWETPAKEFCVGQSMDGARETVVRKVALGGRLIERAVYLEHAVVSARERSTRNGGSKGSQGWDEGENPHSMLLGRKECDGERVGDLKRRRSKKRRGPLERQEQY